MTTAVHQHASPTGSLVQIAVRPRPSARAATRVKTCKVAFVINRLGFQENLSIPILSGIAADRGHQTRLFDARRLDETWKDIADFAPDIIGYSVCSHEADDYIRINQFLKERMSFFALAGGPHPTYFPDFINEPSIDGICRGEGDVCFPKFLDRFGSEAMYDVPNFSFRLDSGQVRANPISDLVEDLDAFPFPSRSQLFDQCTFMARNPIKVFMAGRGCPYKCSYCFNHQFNELYRKKGKVLRCKSVDYLIREIRSVAGAYPLTFIKFHDDVFGANRGWLEEFADRYPREVGIPFLCYARPNMVISDYAEKLGRAGCHAVSIAVECANEELRDKVLDRRMSNELITGACSRLRAAGIRINTLSMIGLPGETEKDMLDTIRLNQQLHADYADASILQPYPGTNVIDACRDAGYLDEDNHRFESQYGDTILKFDPEMKNKVFVIHKMFAILVDHPRLMFLLRPLYKMPWLNGLLNTINRYYYGRHLHARIYAGKIPLRLRLRGLGDFFLSKSRT